MTRFAELLNRLAYEHSRNAKLRLMTDYFRNTLDPERGYALAALTGALTFAHAKSNVIRKLIAERVDAHLFDLSYDYVGDLSETVALLWPAPHSDRLEEDGINSTAPNTDVPSLAEVIETLGSLGKTEIPVRLARWLDALDETGRWALLKLVTGGLRIGVSARLAKTAAAMLGDKELLEVEAIWPSLAPPYADVFTWLEGRAPKPAINDPAPFRPAMLAHAIAAGDFAALEPSDFIAEWKWDGIRVQSVANLNHGEAVTRLYSRSGEDITRSFPDLVDCLRPSVALDGELLIMREGRVQSFNVLQQRLNRKIVTAKLMEEFPAHLRVYDILAESEDDLRQLPFFMRRTRLEDYLSRLDNPRIDLSPLVSFSTWDDLAAARADPVSAGAGRDAGAVEGIMLKRRDAVYVPGRPKGLWWKWKREPFTIDAVLMYAQRGHGKRSSYYSDYTFGVWTETEGHDVLVPVGKAYFGFTDQELMQIDKFVRHNTVSRFGPVREVVHTLEQGLVLEVAFEGLARSTRHKSGIAMRFPRISRLRWDKPPRDADRLSTLERMMDNSGLSRDTASTPAINIF